VTVSVMLSVTIRLATSVYEIRNLYDPGYCGVIRELVINRL
jgi:hypothetical protein